MKIVVESCDNNEGIISINGKEFHFEAGYGIFIRANKGKIKYRMELDDDNKWMEV